MKSDESAPLAMPRRVGAQVTPRLTEAFRIQTLVLVAMVCLVFALPVLAQKGRSSSVPVISTGAGCCEPTGVAGYSGDGGPATSANLDFPHGVAVDSSDNFYIADTNNCLIRKVTASSGIITTVAGTVSGGAAGNCSYLGDGGPATSAQIYKIHGVAVDAQGNFYIADGDDNVIRKVAGSTGNISTAAGCCENGGNPGNTGYSGDGGPATSTAVAMNYPGGIAVDSSGNLYIADQGNEVIRMVTAASGVITTLAGCCEPTGVAGYSGDGGPATSAELNTPTGVAVDSAGNVYIADFGNDVIRKVTASTGVISTVAGNGTSGYSGDGGPATDAELANPSGIAVDSAGNLYIADSLNQVIRRVTAATGVITTLAGDGASGYSGDGGPATSAELANPFGLAVDSTGNVYIADFVNTVIRKVTVPLTAATTTTVASSANPSDVGELVTLTATVSGGSSPTGAVGFSSNGTTISGCSAVALSSGQALCMTSALPVGSDMIVATYSGDSKNSGSSGTLTQVVSSVIASSTAVTSSDNPSISGASVTLTATVTPAGPPAPTGTMSFMSNGAAISGCSSVALSSRAAMCETSSLAVGTDSIAASYSGDANYSASSGAFTQLVNPVPAAVQFVPVTPCRVVDTRGATGPFGGPALTAGQTRSFAIPSGPCIGIPADAVAYSLNVTVVPPGPLGYLTIWPTGEGQPTVSTLNSLDGRIKANAAIVPAGTGGAVNVYVNNATNVVLDINGYFEAGTGTSLEFFPLTPCRVADTRKSSGYASGLGSPSLVADKERDFPILSASANTVPCEIPTAAQAYSLNITAVPPGGSALGYVTAWAQGQPQPLVSTLNDLTGTVVANAAIVPAGAGGGVAVYPNNTTDLVIDVNGYFAPAAAGGYSLYVLTPCRVLDTRKTTGNFSGELTVDVAGSTCAPLSSAPAYVFNATVVPNGDLGYLTLWPDTETRPVVSTLNALDADITSNMAIVPNMNGKADAYASGTTQLVLDISAYFAP